MLSFSLATSLEVYYEVLLLFIIIIIIVIYLFIYLFLASKEDIRKWWLLCEPNKALGMLPLIVFIYLLNFFKGQKCLCLELSRWPLEANACYFAYQSCCNLCVLVTKRWEKHANIILINLAQQYP